MFSVFFLCKYRKNLPKFEIHAVYNVKILKIENGTDWYAISSISEVNF